MKVVCTQENLKNGLSIIGKVLSSTNTLPILNNILIRAEYGLLKISSTNLELAISTQVRCKTEEEGGITVVGKTFTDLINNLPNQNATIQTNGTDLGVEVGNYHTSVKTMPAEDFPLIPVVADGCVLSIEAQELKNALDQVVFAASNNQTQPEISGVLFIVNGNELRVVATDRYRLAEKKIKLVGYSAGDLEVIIPQKTIVEISRIIGPQKGPVGIIFTATQAMFSFNNTEVVSRLVDGHYPDYQQIIPTNFIISAGVEKQLLAGALKTTSVFSRTNNSVNLKFLSAPQQLVLTAESSELVKSVVELPCKVEGGDGEVILNHRYLLDCLSGIDSLGVVLKIIDDSSPSLVVPAERDDYLYLVMPIKI
ncbi:MAG: DNA polymerase III subunit beta [Patescibacteria group bacterium]